MDMVRLGPSKRHFLSASGQSAVEYVLLLFVVVSLGLAVFNSRPFKELFGPNSSAFEAVRKRMEYNYRYTQDGREDTLGSEYSGFHDSYVNGGSTHFFSPQSAYPE
jgi:cystathionine beta-lyase/cystathionine gamma-synthase